jgi:hypothetical protein
MTKPVVNNKIIYQNINGLVSRHDSLLDQSVKEGSSPTFGNLTLNGDGLIKGNLYVEGNTTILNTNVIEFEDNILLLNRLESGSGVTLNQSGLEIERGTLENYRMIYNESDSTFKIGLISNLQAVATRQDTPLLNGVMTWNNTERRLDSSNTISINLSLTSTQNATSITQASLILSGGLSVQKDIRSPGQLYLVGSNHSTSSVLYTHQTSHSLNITSPNDIYLTPTSKILIPNDKSVQIGDNLIVSESITNDLNFINYGHINFTLNAGKRINIPNQIPITFSTATEKVFADGSNNMVVTSSQNVNLEPGINKKVYIPQDIGLIFANNNQQISANLSNDLTIRSGNKIFLTPSLLENVYIPTDNGIKFGNSGYQRISSDSTNLLTINSDSDIYLTTNNNKSVVITNTTRSTSITSGALVINGGVGIAKNVIIGESLTCASMYISGNINVAGTLTVVNITTTNLVDTNLTAGIARITTNLAAIGNSNTIGNIFTNSGNVGINVTNPNFNLEVNGTAAFTTSVSSANILAENSTITNTIVTNFSAGQINTDVLNTRVLTIYSTEDAVSITNGGSFTIYGGASIAKKLLIGGITEILDTTPSNSYTEGSLLLHGGLSISCSQNAVNSSNGGSLSVKGGAAIGSDLYIGGFLTCSESTSSRYLTITATDEAINSSTGSVVTFGGIAIKCSSNATNISNGGSFLTLGGASISKDLHVGGSLNVQNTVIDTVTNTHGSNYMWNYFGIVNDITTVSFCEIDFYNGLVQNTEGTLNYGLKLIVTINGTNCSVSHNYYGNIDFNDTNKISCHVYSVTDKFHLFLKVPANTTTNINVRGKLGTTFNIIDEGYNSNPNGNTSNYDISWSEIYSTNRESNLKYTFGNVDIEGQDLTITDYFPIIGKNNINTTSTRDLGLAFQLYQKSNDTASGEIVSGDYFLLDTIPNQTSANNVQIKFSTLANANNDYYNGWWIKIGSGTNTDQVRQILSYNGAQRIAEIDRAWTSQNPSEGDTLYLYNKQFVSFYFDNTNKTFKLVNNTRDHTTKSITYSNYANLEINHLSLNDTTPSLNSTTGSITSIGGISISNTSDSNSLTSGGTFTTLGGASIGKKLYVSDNIILSDTYTTPDASLYIKHDTSTVVLENDNNLYSYIDFIENGTSQRFGIFSDSNNSQFSLTCSTSGNTPDSSDKALTINSSGFVGINTTTNINTALAIKTNNLISTDTNSGYIGLIAGNTSSMDPLISSKVVLYGNNANGSNGNIIISSGTSGSIQFYTNLDTKRLEIDEMGTVNILTSIPSNSNTRGALVVSGGVGISNTVNASSYTSGGALTVAGGTSIEKDCYIGGNIYINGKINSSGSSTSPTINFSNNVNCTLTSYSNNRLITISQEAMLSFGVWITPNSASQNCQIEFSLPNRSTFFDKRIDLVASAIGYTDDDDLVSLFNVLCAGVKNESRGLLKFQSVSTAVHYFSIICRYTIDV